MNFEIRMGIPEMKAYWEDLEKSSFLEVAEVQIDHSERLNDDFVTL